MTGLIKKFLEIKKSSDSSQIKKLEDSLIKLLKEKEKIDIFRVNKGIDYGLREYTEITNKIKNIEQKLRNLKTEESVDNSVVLFKIKKLEEYIDYLKRNKKEVIEKYGSIQYESLLRSKIKELKTLKLKNL